MKCCPNMGFGFWGDKITANFFNPDLEYIRTDPKTGPVFKRKLPALDRKTFAFGTRTAAKVPEPEPELEYKDELSRLARELFPPASAAKEAAAQELTKNEYQEMD